MEQQPSATLLLAGNPNSGKTSVFNSLTGLQQKVGNFAGVTVDVKSGTTTLPNGQIWTVTDLPGAYSLHPTSTEEYLVLQTLLNPQYLKQKHPILYIADATNLERHLLFLTQLMCLGYPLMLGITMTDMSEAAGIKINLPKLSEKLNMPVFILNGRTGHGLDKVKHYLAHQQPAPATPFLPQITNIDTHTLQTIKQRFNTQNDYAAELLLQHYEQLPFFTPDDRQFLSRLAHAARFNSLHAQVADTMQRFDQITPLLAKTVNTYTARGNNLSLTARLDQWLTHPIGGLLIFFLLLFGLFQAIFSFATYPMDWIEGSFAMLSDWVKTVLPDGLLASLLTDGLLAGLSGIVIFVPQIAILFFLIGILEESGYMARAVYLSDNLMRRFGMNGRSLVSLFSGMACAVPAIMATRTITNQKERLLTIMVTPLISCSARIPVYTILVALLIPQHLTWGFFNAQGLMMLTLYLAGILAAFGVAALLKQLIGTRELSFLALELPPYRLPYWKNLLIGTWQKVWVFITEAGKIILLISLLLWGLANFGPAGKMEAAEKQVTAAIANPADTLALQTLIAEARLENSYIGHLGKVIEPVIAPIGFDWKIGIALLTSFAAREVFVGTMATIYSVGGNDESNLRQKMRAQMNPKTNQPVFNAATILSLLVFYIFAMQCMSTLAIVKRETNSWKWTLLQLVYMTVMAYTASWLVYSVMS